MVGKRSEGNGYVVLQHACRPRSPRRGAAHAWAVAAALINVLFSLIVAAESERRLMFVSEIGQSHVCSKFNRIFQVLSLAIRV